MGLISKLKLKYGSNILSQDYRDANSSIVSLNSWITEHESDLRNAKRANDKEGIEDFKYILTGYKKDLKAKKLALKKIKKEYLSSQKKPKMSKSKKYWK